MNAGLRWVDHSGPWVKTARVSSQDMVTAAGQGIQRVQGTLKTLAQVDFLAGFQRAAPCKPSDQGRGKNRNVELFVSALAKDI